MKVIVCRCLRNYFLLAQHTKETRSMDIVVIAYTFTHILILLLFVLSSILMQYYTSAH